MVHTSNRINETFHTWFKKSLKRHNLKQLAQKTINYGVSCCKVYKDQDPRRARTREVNVGRGDKGLKI